MAPRIDFSASMLEGIPRSRFKSAVAKVPAADCKRKYSRFIARTTYGVVNKACLLWRDVEKKLAAFEIAQRAVKNPSSTTRDKTSICFDPIVETARCVLAASSVFPQHPNHSALN